MYNILLCIGAYVTAGPSTAPPKLTVKSVGPTSITYSWKKVNCWHQNGPIIGYRVQLFHHESLLFEETLQGANTTTFTADNLLQCKHTYSVSVAAVNEAGIGILSQRLSPSGRYYTYLHFRKLCIKISIYVTVLK